MEYRYANKKNTNPTTMVPSLHSFSSPHVRSGILASCPLIATVFTTPRTAGSPRMMVPLLSRTRVFLSKTEDAAAISFASAVCAALRAFTPRLRGPMPSMRCASKLTGGYPLCDSKEGGNIQFSENMYILQEISLNLVPDDKMESKYVLPWCPTYLC